MNVRHVLLDVLQALVVCLRPAAVVVWSKQDHCDIELAILDGGNLKATLSSSGGWCFGGRRGCRCLSGGGGRFGGRRGSGRFGGRCGGGRFGGHAGRCRRGS